MSTSNDFLEIHLQISQVAKSLRPERLRRHRARVPLKPVQEGDDRRARRRGRKGRGLGPRLFQEGFREILEEENTLFIRLD